MRILGIILFFIFSVSVFSQQERKEIRAGNKAYENEKFENAEVQYRKALEDKPGSYEASYNLGNAFFKQQKIEEAESQFRALPNEKLSKEDLAKIYHNLGNTYLSAGKLDESIEAYKNALRNNPSDLETKYNLAYAMNMKKNPQNQQQQQQQQQDK
ncbi:MAG: tetratricopeptide repeat protein, partial [Bacteroidales bacterium]|nr:tetratricopeptide repeat protein [Bacteroidales bacterium]